MLTNGWVQERIRKLETKAEKIESQNIKKNTLVEYLYAFRAKGFSAHHFADLTRRADDPIAVTGKEKFNFFSMDHLHWSIS